jgi:hypothetical protein
MFFGQDALAQSRLEENADRCSDAVVKRLGKHFRLSDFTYPHDENGGLIVAGVCKPWPTNRSRTIAAFAYDDGTKYEKQLLLAVVEGPNNRVIASYKGVIPEEDAAIEVSSHSLRLDTARYVLSKNTRAFGLRLHMFRDRCSYEGGYDDELTLFILDGQTIRPVLTETMWHWSYDVPHGAGDKCTAATAGVEVSRIDTNTLISVEPTASNGFADLRLTSIRSDEKKPFSTIVKYNGERYDLEPWRTAF